MAILLTNNTFDVSHPSSSGASAFQTTIIHELSHYMAYTEDYIYSDQPEFSRIIHEHGKGLLNAASYALFVLNYCRMIKNDVPFEGMSFVSAQ